MFNHLFRLCAVTSWAVLALFLAPIPSYAATDKNIGIASYYGAELHGRRTASGTRFNRHALTAAHRSLPFGSRVRVTNLANGKSLIVLINDRGPFVRKRIIDVSEAAARQLGFIGRGHTKVSVQRL